MYTSTRAIWQESWAECLFWGTGQKVQQIMHYWSCMQRFSMQLQSWKLVFLTAFTNCMYASPPPPPHTHTHNTHIPEDVLSHFSSKSMAYMDLDCGEWPRPWGGGSETAASNSSRNISKMELWKTKTSHLRVHTTLHETSASQRDKINQNKWGGGGGGEETYCTSFFSIKLIMTCIKQVHTHGYVK